MIRRFLPNLDDIALFRQAMALVKPLFCDTIAPGLARPRPVPWPRRNKQQAKEMFCAHEDCDTPSHTFEPAHWEGGDTLSYRREGAQRMLLHKLQRGHFHVGAVLDLHGMNAAKAFATSALFLRSAGREGIHCVQIIHGKGQGAHGPVLKRKLNDWLRRREDVLAFCSARRVDGGTGALYVLLRNQSPQAVLCGRDL